MKAAKSIEVVRSSIKSLSSLSYESAKAIVASLSRRYDTVILTEVDTEEDLHALIKRAPDLVFLGMKYVLNATNPAEKIWLSEQLELAGIPHTGSDRSAHELAFHKDLAKKQILAHGLATAKFCVAALELPYIPHHVNLTFPLFVKPTHGGGGQGIDEHSIVRNPEQLHQKITSLKAEGITNILIEQYLEGREFSVAVIKDRASGELTAMPLELVPPKNQNGERMLSLEVKLSNQEEAMYVHDSKERIMIADFALSVFRALGARNYGRIDIRLDSNGTPHFLETNLIPSLISGYGSFPKAYQLNRGVGYDDMLDNIVLLGLPQASLRHAYR